MKANELSAALIAFAPVADGRRADDLLSFAVIFSGGKDETVAARLKRLPASQGLPATLKASLTAIEAGLIAVGAKKYAADVNAALAKFDGSTDQPLGDTVAQAKAALESPPARAPRTRAASTTAQPDQMLAEQLADELTRVILDTSAFSKVLEQLEDSRKVTTPTLNVIGNRFLGNSKSYKGRKAVITDIVNRQGGDLLNNSRSAALKRAS